MPSRAVIYARVSTEEQAREGVSLDVQVRECEAYCHRQGWEVAGVHVDRGLSAADRDRPELLAALGAIAADEDAPDKHPLVLDVAIAEQREAVRLGGDRYRAPLGILLALRKHYDQALPELLSAVEANPKDTSLWGAVIGVYYKMEKMDDALAAARRGVEANPEDVGLQSDLGELLAKTGRTEQAVQVYKTVLELDPDNEEAKRELERLGGDSG